MTKVLFALFLSGLLLAQNPYKIKYADLQEIQNKTKTILSGKVHLQRDTVDVYSKKAILTNNNYAQLFTNVKIVNGRHSKIFSSRATLNSLSNIARFYQNVRIKSAEINTVSDSLYHYSAAERSELFGNVTVNNITDGSVTEGDMVLIENMEQFRVFGNATYALTKDSMFVESDTLYHNAKTNVAEARSRVIIKQKGMIANAKRAVFNRRDSLMKLYDDPYVVFENNLIQGDSIFAFFSGGAIKEIHVHSNAFTVNVVDSVSQKLNRIIGRDIYIYMDENKIKRIRSIKNAISIYYFREENIDKGVNSVSSDSLIVDFADGKVEQTQIFGGVEGTFYPPKFRGIIKNDY